MQCGQTMTSATTIKLPEDLKQRIAPLAEAVGKTAHAWMVEALERQAAMAEARESFLRDAEESAAEVDAGGALYAAEDVAAYLLSRAAGKEAARPRRVRRGATATTRASARQRRQDR
jgi:predicted transcriptional regulator